MEDKIETTVEVHTPKLLKKLIPNRKVATAATLVVAAGATIVVGKFLKDRFDVDVTVVTDELQDTTS